MYLPCGFSSATVRLRNCTFSRNMTGMMGGAIAQGTSQCAGLDIANCIFWGDIPDEIHAPNPAAAGITYSDVDVEDVWPGIGNINADPMFCDALVGNFRLLEGSLCIDSGNDDAVPEDDGDVDDNGTTNEILPWDADTAKAQSHYGRFFNVDFGPGTTDVDMGAYENQHIAACLQDTASAGQGPPPDGDVGNNEFLRLLSDWGYCPGCGADFNCDLEAGTSEFLEILAKWGACPASSPSSFGGVSPELAILLMGYTNLAAYEAWVLKATDAEVQASVQILAELLLLLE
jgi:hypothetical protein